MYVTALAVLKSSENYAVWHNGRSAIFGIKVQELETRITALGEFIRTQEAAIEGHAEAKEREEDELELFAYEIATSLVVYLRDHRREPEAATIDLSLNGWHRLRADSMIEKARLVLHLLGTVVTQDATGAAHYGLNEADVDDLQSGIADYHEVIHAPQVALSARKALTRALRPRFQEISILLKDLDQLIQRFRSTAAGQHFIDTWKNARRIRHYGVGQSTAAPAAAAPAH